jgi:hypothetical protein
MSNANAHVLTQTAPVAISVGMGSIGNKAAKSLLRN